MDLRRCHHTHVEPVNVKDKTLLAPGTLVNRFLAKYNPTLTDDVGVVVETICDPFKETFYVVLWR
jgi:hypothetical protein